MKNQKGLIGALLIVVVFASVLAIRSQDNAFQATVQVHMVVTDEAVHENQDIPVIRPEDVQVRQGKDRLQVSQWIPARGDQAALQLFILIDDTCDTAIGSNLNDLRDFINAQPATTFIGIGYMQNATVNIVENFTDDHAKAGKALRLPRGSLSASDSPYLSLISLLKGWPESKVRREVVMVTDGIDRLRGERPSGGSFGGAPRSIPSMSPDVDSASTAAQRYGVIVHTIYARGVGRLDRNYWQVQMGLSGISKLSDEAGGESFSLGTGNAVSFKPYVEQLQRILDNQYFLVFQAKPGKKAGLQRVKIATEKPNVELVSADGVWVPVANQQPSKVK